MSATVECHGVPAGFSGVTASLFPDGSDTAADTGLAASYAANRKGVMTFANSGGTSGRTGLHAVQLISNGNIIWYGWCVLATSGELVCSDERLTALHLTSQPAVPGDQMALTAAALDAILIESSITAGATLVNDSGVQLTSINARQALALIQSALAAVLAGAAGTTVTTKPAGKPTAVNPRITATVDSNGNRTALTLRVPD